MQPTTDLDKADFAEPPGQHAPGEVRRVVDRCEGEPAAQLHFVRGTAGCHECGDLWRQARQRSQAARNRSAKQLKRHGRGRMQIRDPFHLAHVFVNPVAVGNFFEQCPASGDDLLAADFVPPVLVVQAEAWNLVTNRR